MDNDYKNDSLMTVDDVARYLCVKPTTIYKWVNDGKLKCIRLNNRTIRFDKEAVSTFVESSISNS